MRNQDIDFRISSLPSAHGGDPLSPRHTVFNMPVQLAHFRVPTLPVWERSSFDSDVTSFFILLAHPESLAPSQHALRFGALGR